MDIESDGSFITFEGIEGCGKSTQAKMLYEHLVEAGFAVVPTREPGATAIGRVLRETLLSTEFPEMDPRSELLLFAASRAQHVMEVLHPSLAAGKIVVCDRYVDSTIAYQAYGRGLPVTEARRISDWASSGLMPDLTFLLDLPVERALERLRPGEMDRIELADVDFHRRVREGFLSLAAFYPERFHVLDATQPAKTIHIQVIAAVNSFFDAII
jgi:dTMP kinase